jgi:hypothetical protein
MVGRAGREWGLLSRRKLLGPAKPRAVAQSAVAIARDHGDGPRELTPENLEILRSYEDEEENRVKKDTRVMARAQKASAACISAPELFM